MALTLREQLSRALSFPELEENFKTLKRNARVFDPTEPYETNDIVLYDNNIYVATAVTVTFGSFIISEWDRWLNFDTLTGNTGSVLFFGVDNLITEDNTNLFFDDSANRLGIGTNSTTHTLTVGGNAYIEDTIVLNHAIGESTFTFQDTGVEVASILTFSDGIAFGTTSTQYMYVNPTQGGIGFGVQTPTQLVDVNGNIRLRSSLYDEINSAGSANDILTVGGGSGVLWQSVGDLNLATQTWVLNQNYTSGYTFQNGLTNTSGTVELGGSIIKDTTLSGSGSETLLFNFLTGFTIDDVNDILIDFDGTFTITDSNGIPKGVQYFADYSTNYTLRSLVDKEYVDTTNDYVSGATWDSNSDLLTLNRKNGGSVSVFITGLTGVGGFTEFLVAADSGSTQTISSGDTLSILGGLGIVTSAHTLDSVTIDVDETVLLTNLAQNISSSKTFLDNFELQFGDTSDFRLYHNGNFNYIRSESHSLFIDQYSTNPIQLRYFNGGSFEQMLVAEPNSGVTMYYNDVAQIQTTDAGVDIFNVPNAITGVSFLVLNSNSVEYRTAPQLLNDLGIEYATYSAGSGLTLSTGGTFSITPSGVTQSMLDPITIQYIDNLNAGPAIAITGIQGIGWEPTVSVTTNGLSGLTATTGQTANTEVDVENDEVIVSDDGTTIKKAKIRALYGHSLDFDDYLDNNLNSLL